MVDEPSDDKKNELLSAVRGAIEEAKITADEARAVIERAQNVQDIARYTEEFVLCVPNDSYFSTEKWNDQTNQWNRWSEYSRKLRTESGKPEPFSFATDVRSIGASGMFFSLDIPGLPPEAQDRAWEVKTTFLKHIEQPNLVAGVEAELYRLHLNVTRAGNESAQDLLTTAVNGLQAPSSDSAAAAQVLIPLRGAIDQAISDLISRRPKQEKSKNIKDKVHSIYRQCGFNGIRQEDVTTLAQEAYELNDILSASKNTKMSREDIKACFDRGLRFFQSFLRGIDHTNLRN